MLQYIRNQSKRFHTFVANRLSVIHENSAPHQWRYVSSEDNPADEVSRGLTVEEMSTSSKWLSGPEFLKKKEEFWPCDPTIHRSGPSDDDPEIKRETHSHSQSLTRHRSEVLSRLIEYYSSWDRLRRAVAWLLRFRTWLIERHSSRFINLRGCPVTVYSDNGTNFQAGERELRGSLNDLNQESIHRFLRQKNIRWKFNPLTASHMGGAWERTIRSVRKILRALLGQQTRLARNSPNLDERS